MGMGKINLSKSTFLILFLAVGFFVGISFSSVYAGIPWDTAEIADNAITSEKIQNKQVKGPDIKRNVITTGKIRDGTITSVDIADGAVMGQHIGFYTKETTFSGLSTGQNNLGFVINCDIGDFAISGGLADDNVGIPDEFAVKKFVNVKVENLGSHQCFVTIDVLSDSIGGIGITLHVVCLDFAPAHT